MAKRRSKTEKLALRAEVFRLHAVERLNNAQISSQLCIDPAYVTRLIQEYHRESAKPLVDEERERDLALIEEIVNIARQEFVKTHDPAQAAIIDKFVTQRAKLIGAYVPTETKLSGSIITDPINAAVADLLTEMDKKDQLSVE